MRLVFLQIVDGQKLQKEAVEQQTRDNEVASKRGTIYDRNQKPLAQSSTVETVTANPNEIRKAKKDANSIAAQLAATLDMEAADIEKLLAKETNHVTIKRDVYKRQDQRSLGWNSRSRGRSRHAPCMQTLPRQLAV